MLIDGRQVPNGTTIETDVCVIGAGAAGITLALALGGTDRSVALIESGGFEFDRATQSLYDGKSVGRTHVPLSSSRVRFFGGTTNHWGGWCRPLENIDFESRAWVPHSGWPIARRELDPFYRRAHEIVGLGPFAYDAASWERRGQGRRMPLDPQRFDTVMFQMHATRFGVVYREQVLKLNNVRTLIHSNVVELVASGDSREISDAHVATFAGNTFKVRSRIYIVACGAIENARILLASNRARPAGIGNEHDLVGRFFMDHLQFVGAAELLPVEGRFDPSLYLQRMASPQVFGAVVPTDAVLEANRSLGFGMTVLPRFPKYLDQAAYSEGWESFRALARRAAGGPAEGALTKHLWNVLSSMDRVANAAYGRLAASRVIRQYGIKFQSEQMPNPDSRVTLDEDRDPLGMRRTKLEWRLAEEDFRTIRNGLELFAREVGRAGIGRLQIPDRVRDLAWRDAVIGSWHHMGTTRMASDAKKGVVDSNCRVHSMANLYIAGSSVFPTVGYANPTLTLTALALRLAERVKAVLR
ncbi:MAG TPA: GMC family oxidoreductase [Longimicrobiales bacterium]